MNWLAELFNRILQFWPFEKLQLWERGIRNTYLPEWHDYSLHLHKPYFRKLHIPARVITKLIGPGMHRRVLFFDEIRKESVVPQVMDLLSQTVVLRNGTVVSFSVNIEYEILDAEANITKVQSFESSLEAASRVHLARRVRDMADIAELIDKQKWLEDSLAGTLSTRAKKWGATINDVGFTDLMPSRAYRLLGDNPWRA
jgi:regulator of protease activity HflC (stomatin/prohibitin superfamily)